MIIVTVQSSQVMCNHVMSQLLWKAPTSSARLKLVRGSSVWPINLHWVCLTQSELVFHGPIAELVHLCQSRGR